MSPIYSEADECTNFPDCGRDCENCLTLPDPARDAGVLMEIALAESLREARAALDGQTGEQASENAHAVMVALKRRGYEVRSINGTGGNRAR